MDLCSHLAFFTYLTFRHGLCRVLLDTQTEVRFGGPRITSTNRQELIVHEKRRRNALQIVYGQQGYHGAGAGGCCLPSGVAGESVERPKMTKR